MAFEPGVVRQASEKLLRQKQARALRRDQLEQELYRLEPELRQLDQALRSTMLELANLAAGKPLEPGGPELQAVRSKNLELQTRRAALLRQLGHSPEGWRKPTPALCAETRAGPGAGCAVACGSCAPRSRSSA